MAAQERAKQAQMKQAPLNVPPIEHKSTTILPDPTQMNMNSSSTTKKNNDVFNALNGIVDNAMGKEKESEFKPPVLPVSTPSLPTPQFAFPPMNNMSAPAPSMMNTTATAAPPPSFDIFEQQQKKEEEKSAAFDNSFNMLGMEAPVVSAPPTTVDSVLDSFNTVAPQPPTETVPPTSTSEAAILDDDNMFEYDMDGNKLSPEERRKLMDEQRAIMEQIKKQAVENKASEAAVRASAFETRMAETALTQNHFSSPPPPPPTSAGNGVDLSGPDVDLSSVDPAQVAEQRAILEEIERQKAQRAAGGVNVGVTTATSAAYNNASTGAYLSPAVAAPGTVPNAHIAESVREAIQLEEDRKLAEALQQEENQAAAETNRAAPEEEGSWWDTIVGSMGGTESTPAIDPNQRSAEINISRPPGSVTPSQRALHGGNNNVERQGLLGSGSTTSRPAARVAESKPLFSCIADSVTMAATAAGATAAAAAAGASSMVYGDEDEVSGVDTTSFLNVPGEDRDSSSNYAQL